MFKSNVSKVILGVNTLGLLFTNYRAGWVGFLVAVGILFIYVLFDREGVKLAILGGIITTIVALAMMFEIIPGPAVLSSSL